MSPEEDDSTDQTSAQEDCKGLHNVCTHIIIYTHMHEHIRMHSRTRAHTHMHTHTYERMHAHTCTHTVTYARSYSCTHTRMHAETYIVDFTSLLMSVA